MANVAYTDAEGNKKFFKASGIGTDVDPQVVEHQQPLTVEAVQEVRDRLPSNGTASEATLAAINAKLADLKNYTDGLETLLAAANTTQAALSGFVDQIEPKLDTLEARLISIRDRTPALGQAIAANSTPVVLSSDGPFATNFGLQTDAEATSDTGAFNFLQLFKRLLNIKLRTGAQLVANSLAVTLASDGIFAQAFGKKDDAVAATNVADTGLISLIKRLGNTVTEVRDRTSLYKRVQMNSDFVRTFTYLDIGTTDERVATIVSSSASLSATFTDTYSYAGSAGAYRPTSIVRVQS